MRSTALEQLLILLACSVVVVTVFRRMKLPPIVGYLAVGMLLGPEALSLAGTDTTRVLAEYGVVFLVFTLGLEFSYPRMLAMRWEVFGLGGAQVVLTTAVIAAVAWLLGASPMVGVVLGGALAMSSTAIVVRQLTEQLEVNRTHGRLAVGILLFQDLAFVPLLALESALHGQLQVFDALAIVGALLRAAIALLFVLAVSAPSEAATRNFGVSGFDRVRVDGPYRVTLTTGVAPFATASGSATALDAVSIERRITLGMTRTFQHAAVFQRLSCLDNVMIGLGRNGVWRATSSRVEYWTSCSCHRR